MGAFRYAAVLAACSLWLSPSLATAEPAPGEGVYCALAIYSVVSQVAQVCRPTEAPKFQAGLNDAVARLGDYVVKNGGGSRADVERFKKEQGGVGTPKDKLCQGDPLMMYEACLLYTSPSPRDRG